MDTFEHKGYLDAFIDALTCSPEVYTWHYDTQGMLKHGSESGLPLILSTQMFVLCQEIYERKCCLNCPVLRLNCTETTKKSRSLNDSRKRLVCRIYGGERGI